MEDEEGKSEVMVGKKDESWIFQALISNLTRNKSDIEFCGEDLGYWDKLEFDIKKIGLEPHIQTNHTPTHIKYA